ncbi:hypothetical protein [Streptosporangium sp. NPDC051022]|uniref:hypothetical protein n=1 Tax=Streptosporangium sp. NPDC051022 TaxID=3155752 RepID=UPI00342B867A
MIEIFGMLALPWWVATTAAAIVAFFAALAIRGLRDRPSSEEFPEFRDALARARDTDLSES